jgi:hypothetical protein
MERLQLAWLSALAAASGCQVLQDGVIDAGIDAHLRHKHDAHPKRTALLDLQLKATTAPPSGGFARARVTRQRLREYAEIDPTIDVLVAILTMPADQPDWTLTTPEALMLIGTCYWVNLAGTEVSEGPDSEKLTIEAPTSQVLNDVSLAQIMEIIGKGERP